MERKAAKELLTRGLARLLPQTQVGPAGDGLVRWPAHPRTCSAWKIAGNALGKCRATAISSDGCPR